jgi:hypothetical protein
VVSLSPRILQDIRFLTKAFHQLRGALVATDAHKALMTQHGLRDPGNMAVMMSYDYHINSDGHLKLIEVNTNASFLLLGWEMYKARGLENPVADFGPERWKADISEELDQHARLFGKTVPANPQLSVIDNRPQDQRLYLEFLIAREWMREQGFAADIRDLPDTLKDPRPDFVYNRSTDFYFQTPESAHLRQAFLDGSVCFSPNPHEYLLMADKERMIEWSQPGGLDAFPIPDGSRRSLQATLLGCEDLNASTAEDLWARRKILFFKPKREFGSKRAFRGASISRKLFDELLSHNMIAQEYVPAPEVTFETPEGPQNFKYDLRCYAYGDRLEGVVARLYQGQVTNLKTPYGGFAPVQFP